MLKAHLRDQIRMTGERALLLLACLCPYDPLDEYAVTVLRAEDGDQVANALELIESVAPRDLWLRMFPIFASELTEEDRVKSGRSLYGDATDSIDDALEEYLTSPSELWPAFVLDLCIKNEHLDFLDSVPWRNMLDMVTELTAQVDAGTRDDGAQLILEVLDRDNAASRKKLKEVKDNLVRDRRKKEMKASMAKASKETDDQMGFGKRFIDNRKKKIGAVKSAMVKSAFGDSVSKVMVQSVDMMRSTDAEAGSGGKSDDELDGEEEDEADKRSCRNCWKKPDDGLNESKKEKLVRLQKERKEKTRLLKLTMDYQVRFHAEFGNAGDETLLVIMPEEDRREAMLERHYEEQEVASPSARTVDGDVMKDFIQSSTNNRQNQQAAFSLKAIFRKKQADTFMQLDGDEEEAKQQKAKKKKQKKQAKKAKAGDVEVARHKPTDKQEEEMVDLFGLGYRGLFFNMDVNCGRSLDDEEFARFLDVTDMHGMITEAQVDELKKEMNTSKSGEVSWAEWVFWWRGSGHWLVKLKTLKREQLDRKLEEADQRRNVVHELALKAAESDEGVWMVDKSVKTKLLVDRRIDVSGKGRGTVLGQVKGNTIKVQFDAVVEKASEPEPEVDAEGQKLTANMSMFAKLAPVAAPEPESDLEAAAEPAEEGKIEKVKLDKNTRWRVLDENRLQAQAKKEMVKYDVEIGYRKDKVIARQQAERDMIAAAWKKEYGVDKKGGLSFGKLIGLKKDEVEEEEKSGETIEGVVKELFQNTLDEDKNGHVDKEELLKLDEWLEKLSLVDDLGMAITAKQFQQARADLMKGKYTLDWEDLLEWVQSDTLVAMSLRLALTAQIDERANMRREMLAKQGGDSGSLTAVEEAALKKKQAKEAKKRKNKKKRDPPFAAEYKMFFYMLIGDGASGYLTRVSLNRMCSLAGVAAMLDRELDLIWREMSALDTSEGGVTEQIFVLWCASEELKTAMTFAGKIVQLTEERRAAALWDTVCNHGKNSSENDVLPTEDLAVLQNITQEQGMKLKKKDLQACMEEIDVDGDGTIDQDEFVAWLTSGSTVADKVRQSGRVNEAVVELFQTLDTDGSGELSIDEVKLEGFQAMGVRLNKKENDKVRKQMGITKTKVATFDTYEAWLKGASKLGEKVNMQLKATVATAMVAETALRQKRKEQSEEVTDDVDDDGAVDDTWSADYLQFSMWMNSESGVALMLNHAAALLQWPEPEPEDLDVLLEEDTIGEIWQQIDWEDDGQVGLSALGALHLVTGGHLDHETTVIFEEIEANEFDLFDRDAFGAWSNGDTEAALSFRKRYRERRVGVSNAAAAKMAAAAAGTAAMAAGAMAAKGAKTAGRLLMKGGVPLTIATGKGAFLVTKVALTATAKITGVGGVLMLNLERYTTDQALSEEQIVTIFTLLDSDENGVLQSQEILKLRTHLGARLSDDDMRHARKELGVNASQMMMSTDSDQMSKMETQGASMEVFAEWINRPEDDVAKKCRAKARGRDNEDDFVRDAREATEAEARLRAFKEPDIWLAGKKTMKWKTKELIGLRVDVRGYGEGTVMGYQKKRPPKTAGGHWVDFDIAGTVKLKLDAKSVNFTVSDEKFVDEYIDIAMSEFEAEEVTARQLAEDAALASAMKIPDAWVLGRTFAETPLDLIGCVIEVGGKMGRPVGYRSKTGHDVQFDDTQKLVSMDLFKGKFRVLNDDFIMAHSQSLVKNAMNEWGTAQMAAIEKEREEIVKEETAVHQAKMQLYMKAQAAQALADAVTAAAYWVRIELEAYRLFCIDFRPSCEALMDAQLVEDAGGVDSVLHGSWISLPISDRAVLETRAKASRENKTGVKMVRMPTFDEAYAEQLKEEASPDASVVESRLPLDDHTLEVLVPFLMTGAEREQLKQELGGGSPDIRYEDFACWLGARESSDLGDSVKRSIAMLRWAEMGPLLVYEPEPDVVEEEDGERFKKFKYVGKGGLMLTKFTLKGAWVATKVVGKVAIPVTRVALQATAVASDLAEAGLTQIEKRVVEADATQVKALFSWLHEELGVVTAMAPIALTPGELSKSLEELGLEEPGSEEQTDLKQFGEWLLSRSKLAGKLLEAVADQSSGVEPEQLTKAELKAAKKEEKKAAKVLAKIEKKSADEMQKSADAMLESGDGDVGVKKLAAKDRFDVMKGVLHNELERIDEAFENDMSWSDFEKMMKELEGEDGEVSFQSFMSWMGGDRSKSNVLGKVVKELAARDQRDADAVEFALLEAEAQVVADRVAAVNSIFEELQPDPERRRVTRANFVDRMPDAAGVELSLGEKKRALRYLDPTNLGFIKDKDYVRWMDDESNRVGPNMLAGYARLQEPAPEDGVEAEVSEEPEADVVDSGPEVAGVSRYLFDCLDNDRDGEYIPIEALQRIPDVAGLKLSKAEKASLKSNHVLDPDQLHDCYIVNLDTWLWSDEKLPKKVLAALQKENVGFSIPLGISEDFADELKQARVVDEQFQELSGGSSEMQADSLEQLIDLHGLSQAEVSRCAELLDPDETGIITEETWKTVLFAADDKGALLHAAARTIIGHANEAVETGEIFEHVESNLTDEELKSLFLMLNEAGDGSLTRGDFSNIDFILNIQCSDQEIERAMREMSLFAKADEADAEEQADAATSEAAKAAVAAAAATSALSELDAWVLLKSKELNELHLAEGTLTQLNLPGRPHTVCEIVAWKKKGKVTVRLRDTGNATKAMSLTKAMGVHVLSEEFVEAHVEKKLQEWEENEKRKAQLRQRKRRSNFERSYRARVEEDAIKQACQHDAAWMPATHIAPATLVGQRVKLDNYALPRLSDTPGEVVDYTELVGLHTVKFDDIGLLNLDLGDGPEFEVLSEKFEKLFVQRIMTAWDTERQKQRNEVRTEAREVALVQQEAWTPGGDDPEPLKKGDKIDLKGFGQGVYVGSAPKGLSKVNFPTEGGTAEGEGTISFENPLTDNKISGTQSPRSPRSPQESVQITREIDLNLTRYRVLDRVFINMFVLKQLKDAAVKEATELRAQWASEGTTEEEVLDGQQKKRSQMTVSDLVADEIAKLWVALDADGEGEIDRNEINTLSTVVGQPFKDWELNLLMKEMDTNGSGMICFEEFGDWLNSNSSIATTVKGELTKAVMGELTNLDRATKAGMTVKEAYTDLATSLFMALGEDEAGIPETVFVAQLALASKLEFSPAEVTTAAGELYSSADGTVTPPSLTGLEHWLASSSEIAERIRDSSPLAAFVRTAIAREKRAARRNKKGIRGRFVKGDQGAKQAEEAWDQLDLELEGNVPAAALEDLSSIISGVPVDTKEALRVLDPGGSGTIQEEKCALMLQNQFFVVFAQLTSLCLRSH